EGKAHLSSSATPSHPTTPRRTTAPATTPATSPRRERAICGSSALLGCRSPALGGWGASVARMARATAPAVELEVRGRTVRVSSPDRVYFPERGLTKLDIVQYFVSVGDGILGALRDRPTTL